MAQVKRFLSGKKFRIFAHLNFRIRTSEFCDYKNGQKCDKLILAKVPNVNKKWIGYFVELKGSAITKAIAQLENTITHSKFNDSTLTKRYARIVSSVGIPANNGNTELEKARNRFRSQYNCELKRLKPNQPDRI